MFTLSPKASTNGCSLQARIDVSNGKMRQAFGPPKPEAYWCDEEKGYDGDEWTFTAEDGRVFNVYSRWASSGSAHITTTSRTSSPSAHGEG